MRLYETSFLIAPTLPEEEAEKLIEKMAGIISEKNGKMINVDKWGKRRLAYPIKKFEDAVYVFFLYKGDVEIPVELERNFKQTESVIRYLTIKMEERDNIRRAKKGAARAAEPAREGPPAEEPSEPTPVEKPEPEKAAEEKKAEKAEEKGVIVEEQKKEQKKEQKEEKKEKKEAEQKEEVKAPSKKKEEAKEEALKKKGKDPGTKKNEGAPKKEEPAVKEEKEK